MDQTRSPIIHLNIIVFLGSLIWKPHKFPFAILFVSYSSDKLFQSINISKKTLWSKLFSKNSQKYFRRSTFIRIGYQLTKIITNISEKALWSELDISWFGPLLTIRLFQFVTPSFLLPSIFVCFCKCGQKNFFHSAHPEFLSAFANMTKKLGKWLCNISSHN